jgi:hypothetical protein
MQVYIYMYIYIYSNTRQLKGQGNDCRIVFKGSDWTWISMESASYA